ncbi:MAG: class I SAM-dependent methyltransferase [Bacteroidota bacterium]|nr:class I SAM-dependent methyltransferase [Bacteroidota bacterium]
MSGYSDPTEAGRIARVYGEYERADCAAGKWSGGNRGNTAILRERRTLTARFLERYAPHGIGTLDILEVGCGEGQVIAELIGMGADPSRVTGVDILETRIGKARDKIPGVRFLAMDAAAMDFPDGSFDLVVLFTVLSSVLDDGIRKRIAGEIDRVLKPGGAVLCYDMRVRNPANPNVRGVGRRTMAALFPGYTMHACSLTLLPPLARRLGPLTPILYTTLASVPFLRSHLMVMLVKGAP